MTKLIEKNMESKTHWKKYFNPDYIGAYILEPGEEKIVTITAAGMEEITGTQGRKEECLVLKLQETKPMILNKTNAKAIAKVAGSDFLEDWIGVKIQLFAKRVDAFGDQVLALRVRDFKPKAQKQKIDEARFQKMLEAIKAGKFSKQAALDGFELTNSQKGLISAL